jgi:MarR family transcriptional repressor of emrRAB
VCNELELRGLIHRGTRAGDRRAVMISLTATGRELIVKALPAVWGSAVPIYEGIGDAEMDLLESLYARQLANIENMI